MKTESATGERSVEVSTTVRATPATVWGILTDADRFSDWIQGHATFEPKAGSRFSIDFPQFETVIRGEVVEVAPERRIVFTWGVAEGEQHPWFPPGSSTLSIELAPIAAGRTKVSLVHGDLPEREVSPHHDGWRFHLDRMDLWANRVQLSDRLAPRLDAWCAAWSESDDQARSEHLARCCTENLRYADEYAELEGREMLAQHVGNAIRTMPASRLETGAPRVNRGLALVEWRVMTEDDDVLHRGHLVVEADDAGRFRRVTNFRG